MLYKLKILHALAWEAEDLMVKMMEAGVSDIDLDDFYAFNNLAADLFDFMKNNNIDELEIIKSQ